MDNITNLTQKKKKKKLIKHDNIIISLEERMRQMETNARACYLWFNKHFKSIGTQLEEMSECLKWKEEEKEFQDMKSDEDLPNE